MEQIMIFLFFILIIILAFVGFVIYFIFKQLEFVLRAVNLYKKMINREDLIIKILLDIRDNTQNVEAKDIKKLGIENPISNIDIDEKDGDIEQVTYETGLEHLLIREGSSITSKDIDQGIRITKEEAKNPNSEGNVIKKIHKHYGNGELQECKKYIEQLLDEHSDSIYTNFAMDRLKEVNQRLGIKKDQIINQTKQKDGTHTSAIEEKSATVMATGVLLNTSTKQNLPQEEECKENLASEDLFKIVFSGEILPEKSLESVKTDFMELYKDKYDIKMIDRLFFSGNPVLIRKNITYQKAIKQKEILTNRTGGIFVIESM